jgi:hypothetical protein
VGGQKGRRAVLSEKTQVMIQVLLEKNDEKIAEWEKSEIKEGSQAASFVDHLKRQNIFFRKILDQ